MTVSGRVYAGPIILQPVESVVLYMDFTELLDENETIKSSPIPVVTVEGPDAEVESADFTSIGPNASTITKKDGTTIATGKAVTMLKAAGGTPNAKYRVEVQVETTPGDQIRQGDGILWIVD